MREHHRMTIELVWEVSGIIWLRVVHTIDHWLELTLFSALPYLSIPLRVILMLSSTFSNPFFIGFCNFARIVGAEFGSANILVLRIAEQYTEKSNITVYYVSPSILK